MKHSPTKSLFLLLVISPKIGVDWFILKKDNNTPDRCSLDCIWIDSRTSLIQLLSSNRASIPAIALPSHAQSSLSFWRDGLPFFISQQFYFQVKFLLNTWLWEETKGNSSSNALKFSRHTHPPQHQHYHCKYNPSSDALHALSRWCDSLLALKGLTVCNFAILWLSLSFCLDFRYPICILLLDLVVCICSFMY